MLKKKIHVLVNADVYKKLWIITSKRFDSPARKVHIVINEALKEYVDKYFKEDESIASEDSNSRRG